MVTNSTPQQSAVKREPDHELVIVGSGFSGIGAAIKLREQGFSDFIILEKADDLGGTWRDNDYPGLAVDMPSFIYSYPFEMNAEWSRVYAPAKEIKAYVDDCADKYGVRSHIRFASKVVRCEYDEQNNLWITSLDDGEVIASRYFVSATGLLVEPKMPDIEGIDSFEGKLMHSARWEYDYDLSSKRVAVIGTGATAIQLIPAIAGEVAHLDVYQRTAIWLMGKPDAEISPRLKTLFRTLPFLQTGIRWLINLLVEFTLGPGFIHHRKFPWMVNWLEKKLVQSIRDQVDDPEIQEKLIPPYSFFCKRPSFSNVYYSTFNRDHVELVTDPIAKITANAIVSKDGTNRPIDTLICATGYSVFDRHCMPNFEVWGRDSKNLGEFWETSRFQAYEGATVPGFPNFFLFMGPYSAAGASYFTMIDTQTRHLLRCLKEARRRNANYIEVKQSAHDRDFAKVNYRRLDTLPFSGDCTRSNSYYFDKHGDTPGLRPVTGGEHWLRSLTFSLKDYIFEAR
jgi:cation diffusion facilitator CzcD-associated flavoprotein CzcO